MIVKNATGVLRLRRAVVMAGTRVATRCRSGATFNSNGANNSAAASTVVCTIGVNRPLTVIVGVRTNIDGTRVAKGDTMAAKTRATPMNYGSDGAREGGKASNVGAMIVAWGKAGFTEKRRARRDAAS
jgi:hypothetical protein